MLRLIRSHSVFLIKRTHSKCFLLAFLLYVYNWPSELSSGLNVPRTWKGMLFLFHLNLFSIHINCAHLQLLLKNLEAFSKHRTSALKTICIFHLAISITVNGSFQFLFCFYALFYHPNAFEKFGSLRNSKGPYALISLVSSFYLNISCLVSKSLLTCLCSLT